MLKPMIILSLLVFSAGAAVPSIWNARGVGGGGALFSPSINPVNDNEYYVSCDMSELFHTIDFGASYTVEPFYRITGGHNSAVQFTANPLVRYCISYQNDKAVPVKSNDGGTTWSALSGNPNDNEEVFSINVDYNNPARIVLGYYSTIYFSLDSGRNFAPVHSAANDTLGCVIGGAFFDGTTIYLGTSDGLLVSVDGGGHFLLSSIGGIATGEAILSFTGAKQGGGIKLFCLTGNYRDIYSGLVGSDYWDFVKGVYTLNVGSATWVKKMNGITIGHDFPMFAAMARNDTATCYLAGSTSAGEPLVLKTVNGGTTWSSVFNTAANANIITGWSGAGGDRGFGYGECAFGLAVAANNANKVLISDFGFVHKTANGGTSWQQAYGSSADQHAAGALTPPRRYYHSSGIENTTCWQIAWIDSLRMFAAYSDIKGVRSVDGGQSWSFDYSGHNANTMYRVVKTAAGTLYAGTSGIHDLYQSTRLADATLDAVDAEGKIVTSSDSGRTWSAIHTFGHPVFWVALDPTDAHTMYASVVHSTLGGIFVSHDIQNGASSTWSKLANPPRTQGHPATIVVLNDKTVVCTYSGRRTTVFTPSSGVFVYTSSSNSWSDVSHSGMQYWTKDIVVDPFDMAQNTWYAGVFSGWGGASSGLGGLYKTTSRGASWTRISDLDRVTSCTINPQDAAEAYVTTEASGLWHSQNFNAATPSFARVDSYPFRQPERVFFNPYKKSEIWVSSFGNGMRMGSTALSSITNHAIHSAPRNPLITYHAGIITIKKISSSETINHITIHALDGRTVFKSMLTAVDQSIKTGGLRSGYYIVSVNGKAGTPLLIPDR